MIGALCDALDREGTTFGLCSIGRDGEAVDALESSAKPRFRLHAGSFAATAAGLVPAHPSFEIVDVTDADSALGPIVFVRARAAGYVEIAGPPSATALRRIANELARRAEFVLVDGAVDRIAALRDGDDGIVIAVGAAAPTIEHAVADVRALVRKLALPRFDPARDAVRVGGALTAERAAEFARDAERRQIVVADPTRVAFGGRTLLTFLEKLDVRCERALRPIACTVAPRNAVRSFDPRAFARAVADATGLPAYDVFAGLEAA